MMVAGVAFASLGWATDGFESAGTAADCELFLGPEVAPGLPQFRAHCHWPTADPRALIHLLSDVPRYDDLFWMVTAVDVLPSGPTSLVTRQRHEVPFARARESVTRTTQWWTPERFHLSWTALPTTPVDPRAIPVGHNDGSWEVITRDQGGAELTFHLAYDPGGRVPRWMVSWAQSVGAVRMLRQLRAAALAAADPEG